MNNKKWIGTVFATLFVAILTGCDGISGTGGPSRGTDDNSTGKEKPKDGQALLGPIVGATVTIRDFENIDAVACSATTADNDDLAKAGTVRFSTPCIFDDHLYLVTVVGGNDVDYNDDGVRDATPTPNTGEFRALLSGRQLLQNNWKTNALTESVYQATQYASQTGATDVVTTIDDIARQLIRQDLNGDGIVDHRDISLWHPVADAASAINGDKLRASTQLIHQNLNRTLPEIPDAESLSGRIDTLAPARQVLTHGNDLLVTTDTALLIYHYDDGTSTLLSSLALGWIYDMATLGDSLYVALGENGIAQIDISDGANPQVTQRWPNTAERLTTLGNRVIFSYVDETGWDALAQLDGASTTFIATSMPELWPLPRQINLRKYSADESVHSGLLKTVGDTVYWSPSDSLQRFVIENDEWRKLSALFESEDYLRLVVFDDVEVFNNTLFVALRSNANSLALATLLNSPAFYEAPQEEQFDLLLAMFHRNVQLFDITDPAAPVARTSYGHDDISAIRRWDNDIVALGTQDISIRYAADLRSKLSLRLPETFSGFYPSKGLARIDDMLVVAAKENGVLFLKTTNIPVKKYYGSAFIEGPVVNSRVVVTPKRASAGSCDLQSDAMGMIAIPESCIANDDFYDITVIGGEQIVNGESRPFLGTMHAIMASGSIMESGWLISPLTELGWRTYENAAQNNFGNAGSAEFFFSYWWLDNTGTEFNQPFRLEHWHPQTDMDRLRLTPELWQLATQAVSTATWTDETTAKLIAPYSAFYSFGEPINDVVATEHLVLVLHPFAINVLSHDNSIEWLQRLPEGADQIFAHDNIVVTINRLDNRLKAYSTQSGNRITQIHDITDSFLDYMPAFCAAGELLFSMKHEEVANTAGNTVITAWSIASNELEELATLRIPARELDETDCNSNTLIASDSHRLDVITFANNRLTLADTAVVPTNGTIGDVFFGGSQIYVSGDDTEEGGLRHYIYGLDTSGHLTLTHTVTPPADTEIRISGYADVGGTQYFASGWRNLALANAATKQNVTVTPLPVGVMQGLLASKENIWIWAGDAIWTIDARKVLAQ